MFLQFIQIGFKIQNMALLNPNYLADAANLSFSGCTESLCAASFLLTLCHTYTRILINGRATYIESLSESLRVSSQEVGEIK